MAIMRRVTIAEAALALGVPEEEIADRITSGALVACQEPGFKKHVWFKADVKPIPKRRTRRTTKATPIETPMETFPVTLEVTPEKPVEAPTEVPAKGRKVKTKTPTPVASKPTGVAAKTSGPVTADQPAGILTIAPDIEAPTSASDQTADLFSDELEPLRESVFLLRKDLENREALLSQVSADLESSRQEVLRLSLSLEQIQVEPATPPVKLLGRAHFWRHKASAEEPTAVEPASTQLEDEPKPVPQVYERQEMPTPKPKWRFWYGIMPDILKLASLFDLRIGKFVARTCLRFSHPLL